MNMELKNIILVILTASLVITMPMLVRIVFTKTYNDYFIFDETSQKYILAARENILLYSGTTKMLASYRNMSYVDEGEYIRIIKHSKYKDNITLVEEKIFNKNNTDVEKFPETALATCYGCKGKIIMFEYSKIELDLETQEVISPFEFSPRMKLEWQNGSYYNKFLDAKTTTDKIQIKYRPLNDVEQYNVRIYDPILDEKVITEKDVFISEKLIKQSEKIYCVEKVICNPTKTTVVLDVKQSIVPEACYTKKDCFERKLLLDEFKIESKDIVLGFENIVNEEINGFTFYPTDDSEFIYGEKDE